MFFPKYHHENEIFKSQAHLAHLLETWQSVSPPCACPVRRQYPGLLCGLCVHVLHPSCKRQNPTCFLSLFPLFSLSCALSLSHILFLPMRQLYTSYISPFFPPIKYLNAVCMVLLSHLPWGLLVPTRQGCCLPFFKIITLVP